MNSAIISCVLVLCATRVLSSVTLWPPTLQRKNTGDNCAFRWNVTGNFSTYDIKLISSGNMTSLGSNTNFTVDRNNGVMTLIVWNIQISNAGYYSLSITAGPSTKMNSTAVLFVYASPYSIARLAVGRNPSFEGDKIEINCSTNSASLPVEYQPKMYYSWHSTWYSEFQTISGGQIVLQNGDTLPGYSLKNEGKTLVIASAQITDSSFFCTVQEEGSPYKSPGYYEGVTIYSKPNADSFTPRSRKTTVALFSRVNFNFYCEANPPLTSYTNWSFVSTSGTTAEYPLGYNPLFSFRDISISLSFELNSVNSYGSYSITLRNSNGSITETFQVLPPGPPDAPSNFSVQHMTHRLVSLQWRCMWSNGAQQAVFVRLVDAEKDEEVETQTVFLAIDCYNLAYSTLFQDNIQPETNYLASIWSFSTLGTSDVVQLAFRTPKGIVLETSPADISIVGSHATVIFRIAESTAATLGLNIVCCVELTAQCNNQSYIITSTENRFTYDTLPPGTEYVFDFIVYETDGSTCTYTLAMVKGVRVSRTEDASENSMQSPCAEEKNPMIAAVIVLAVLLGAAVFGLIGYIIGDTVRKRRQSTTAQASKPNRSGQNKKEPSDYASAEDQYETVREIDLSSDNAYYKSLEITSRHS